MYTYLIKDQRIPFLPLIFPRSYYSRIGAQLPAHLGTGRMIRNEETPQNTPFSPSMATPNALPPIQDDILS